MILNGKALALKIEADLQKKISTFKSSPGLAIVLVGERPDSFSYVKQKMKVAERIGIKAHLFSFASNVKEEELEKLIIELNDREDISGIIVQLPLPKKIIRNRIINLINPEKDVDGLTHVNQGKFLEGEECFVPATALGVLSLLKKNKVKVDGVKATVVGRSLLVGRPVSILLDREGATVTLCHKSTKDLKGATKNADIVVVAVGHPDLIKKDFVKKGVVVVDVGINVIKSGKERKVVGDVDFAGVSKKAAAISPVPGGVGPMTVISLMENCVRAYLLQGKR